MKSLSILLQTLAVGLTIVFITKKVLHNRANELTKYLDDLFI